MRANGLSAYLKNASFPPLLITKSAMNDTLLRQRNPLNRYFRGAHAFTVEHRAVEAKIRRLSAASVEQDF
jgi:hypothetical protein